MSIIGGGGASGGVIGGGSPGDDPETGPDVSVESLEAARAEGEAATGAEARVEELLAEVAALRRELAAARGAAERAARRAEIERALGAAGAIDLEITVPLVESAVAEMDEPDIAEAVRAVKSGKAFLFRPAIGAGSGASGARGAAMAGETVRGAGLEDLAGDARSSGHRGDLLRYLRARRG
jgi:hypothetical protein